MTKFSIIVPVYNVMPYIKECLDSLVTQNYENYEICIVDDGSTDGSGEICDEYKNKFPCIKLLHQPNQGVSVARNNALDMASGDYIWFVDADDSIVNNALPRLAHYESKYSPDMIIFGHIDKTGNSEHIIHYENDIDTPKDDFLNKTFSYLNQQILFRRSIIENNKLRFSEGVRMAEDLEFQYKYLIHCHKPISITEPLYVYNYRNGSAMRNTKTDLHNMDDCLLVCEKLQNYIRLLHLPEISWLSVRIRGLLKSALQSAEKLSSKDIIGLQNRLRQILKSYSEIGYRNIPDKTLLLAKTNLKLYFLVLGAFLFYRKHNITRNENLHN